MEHNLENGKISMDGMPNTHPHHDLPGNIASHTLSPTDPLNPFRWPLHRKLYASAVAWFFSFAV
jgi:hypothetical protein